jgi:hypothetical protein
VIRLEPDRVAAFYAVPCLMVRAGDVQVFATRAALHEKLGDLLRVHREQGYGRAQFSDLRARLLDPDLGLATVAWTVFDRRGAVLWRFANTYNLGRFDGQWKVVVSITHGP